MRTVFPVHISTSYPCQCKMLSLCLFVFFTWIPKKIFIVSNHPVKKSDKSPSFSDWSILLIPSNKQTNKCDYITLLKLRTNRVFNSADVRMWILSVFLICRYSLLFSLSDLDDLFLILYKILMKVEWWKLPTFLQCLFIIRLKSLSYEDNKQTDRHTRVTT